METWKIFKKTNRAEWQVSTLGRIKKNGEIYTPYTRGGHPNNQYLCLSMNTPHSGYIHRIVADTFIPNLENKRTVNHIDGDKTNNAVSNLEWASYQENLQHAVALGLKESMSKEEAARRLAIRQERIKQENKQNRIAELERRDKLVLEAKEVFKDRQSLDILLEVALWLKERNVKLINKHISIILPNIKDKRWKIKRSLKKVNDYMKHNYRN